MVDEMKQGKVDKITLLKCGKYIFKKIQGNNILMKIMNEEVQSVGCLKIHYFYIYFVISTGKEGILRHFVWSYLFFFSCICFLVQ